MIKDEEIKQLIEFYSLPANTVLSNSETRRLSGAICWQHHKMKRELKRLFLILCAEFKIDSAVNKVNNLINRYT